MQFPSPQSLLHLCMTKTAAGTRWVDSLLALLPRGGGGGGGQVNRHNLVVASNVLGELPSDRFIPAAVYFSQSRPPVRLSQSSSSCFIFSSTSSASTTTTTTTTTTSSSSSSSSPPTHTHRSRVAAVMMLWEMTAFNGVFIIYINNRNTYNI